MTNSYEDSKTMEEIAFLVIIIHALAFPNSFRRLCEALSGHELKNRKIRIQKRRSAIIRSHLVQKKNEEIASPKMGTKLVQLQYHILNWWLP